MRNRSKRYKNIVKNFSKCLSEEHALKEAVECLRKMPSVKFDESVELSCQLGVDPKKSDHMVRGIVDLPNGSGKKVRILVFTEKPEEALAAGADFAGLTDIIEKIQKENWMDFDIAISTTSAMKEVRSVAKVLGPRGLMPNPKSGTVVDDVAQGIQNLKAGRVEFKMNKTGGVFVLIGKKSFSTEHLIQNATKAIEEVNKARPDTFKGALIKNVVISSTMSPGIRLKNKEYAI